MLHSQTGSGKTLAYLRLIFSVLGTPSTVQAMIIVPTRKLGMRVTKVACTLAAKSGKPGTEEKPCTVMALLYGGTLRTHKSWLKDCKRTESSRVFASRV
ncbi:DEAD-box ATP-dependent RNA helicase 58, chloroplastic-like [Daucus carota subsp. sativus]|uniref:DEAD-box ATP-dependent RNA helicase 58, chloroplastic-like n=1 Tax=Daucus carota subsp. sativus TaxID=79200 RepID=UPI00308371E0